MQAYARSKAPWKETSGQLLPRLYEEAQLINRSFRGGQKGVALAFHDFKHRKK